MRARLGVFVKAARFSREISEGVSTQTHHHACFKTLWFSEELWLWGLKQNEGGIMGNILLSDGTIPSVFLYLGTHYKVG